MKTLLLLALLAGHVALAQEKLASPVPTRPAMPRDRYYDRYRRAPSLAQMVITGQVQRQDSLRFRPLPGALVSVVLPGGPQSARTDGNGAFSLTLDAAALATLPDSVAVMAAALGLGSQTIKVKKAAQATAFFHLHLMRLRTLSGRIDRPVIIPPDTKKTSAASTMAFWPPPECSTLKVLTPKYFAQARTLADVDNILVEALDAATYDDLRYYYAPDGFVLITRIEQTDAAGLALPGAARWSIKVPGGVKSSIGSYLKALFIPATGHFRVIAFAVTTQPIIGYRPAPQEGEARAWLQQGADALDPKVGALPYSPGYHCTALIYEFEQSANRDGPLVVPGHLTARQHLDKSRITAALPKLTP